MISFTLDDLQPLLDGCASPLLLFEGDTLLSLNQAARRCYPRLDLGASVLDILSEDARPGFHYDGSGSRLFSGTILGVERDLRVTLWKGHRLLEVLETVPPSRRVMASVAQGILSPLSGVMAAAPELLRQLPVQEDSDLQAVSSQLLQGIYAVFRAGTHLRLCADPSRMRIIPKRDHLSLWLQAQAQLLKPLMEEANRNLELILPPQDILCCFDAEALGQALLNLVSNAMKFTEPGGHIILQLKKTSPKRVCLIVRDDGCGIASDQMGMVFSRQESPRDLPDHRWGIGLGLPLTRAILQQHGGSVILESQPGHGTTVYLALPCTHSYSEEPLHSPVHHPTPFSGFSPALVELSDVLPSRIYDFEDLDG